MSVGPSTAPHSGTATETDDRHVSRGQILVMFAVMLTSLLGAVGLAVDLGVAFSQRRTMQSAADAGAYAGTRIVAKAFDTAAPPSAQADVEAVVLKNAMNMGTVGSIVCNYVNDAGTAIAPCTAGVPATATGVEVTVQETHPTFFIRVVPGAPDETSTSAYARANVKKLGSPSDGPFLPCTINTKLAAGGTMNLLIKVNGEWKVNPAAIGKTFQIHGPQVEKCDAKASRYKGLADVTQNAGRSAPGWFKYTEGVDAGMISSDVEGPDGCKAGMEVVNCVVFLPIVINDPPEQGNDKQLWTVAFAPFYITKPKSNETNGMLLSDYIVSGKGQDGSWGWEQGYDGPITIRLTK